jgi:hypothetical protein
MSEYLGTLRAIETLARDARVLHAQGVAHYTPIVQTMVNTRSRDASHIEHTLDGLLDFACCPEGLQLFKVLCRYYCTLDPTAAAEYVHAYGEMWGAGESPAQEIIATGRQS